MSKKCNIFQPVQPSLSLADSHPLTNWSICVLCQEVTDEKLTDPRNAKNKTIGSGYKTLAENLVGFESLGQVPLDIDTSRLNDGQGIKQTLIDNNAKWHASCARACSKMKLDRKRKSGLKNEAQQESISPVKTRKSLTTKQDEEKKEVNVCFFCEKGEFYNKNKEKFHEALTPNISKNVKECATYLHDSKILTKLAVRDMGAQDAVYHLSCLSAYYYKATYKPKESSSECNYDVTVLAELISYIEDSKHDDDITIFKLSDLSKLYISCLNQLQPDTKHQVNSTRLKDRIRRLIPDLRAESHGQEVLLVYKDDIGDVLHTACTLNNDNQGINMMLLSKQI